MGINRPLRSNKGNNICPLLTVHEMYVLTTVTFRIISGNELMQFVTTAVIIRGQKFHVWKINRINVRTKYGYAHLFLSSSSEMLNTNADITISVTMTHGQFYSVFRGFCCNENCTRENSITVNAATKNVYKKNTNAKIKIVKWLFNKLPCKCCDRRPFKKMDNFSYYGTR